MVSELIGVEVCIGDDKESDGLDLLTATSRPVERKHFISPSRTLRKPAEKEVDIWAIVLNITLNFSRSLIFVAKL